MSAVWVWGRALIEQYRKKHKYLEKNLFQCNFVHHKTHMGCLGIDPRPSWGEAGD